MIPIKSFYQRTIESAWAGSPLDATWNREKLIHDCCGSKADWRHKATCIQVVGSDEEIGNEKWKALDRMDKGKYIKRLFG